MTPTSLAAVVHQKYMTAFDGEIQGCCLLIADEIARATGGAVVAGYLVWAGGSCRRSHWWVDLDGAVLDPMGEDIFAYEVDGRREEEHRDAAIFRSVLGHYEVYRR